MSNKSSMQTIIRGGTSAMKKILIILAVVALSAQYLSSCVVDVYQDGE